MRNFLKINMKDTRTAVWSERFLRWGFTAVTLLNLWSGIRVVANDFMWKGQPLPGWYWYVYVPGTLSGLIIAGVLWYNWYLRRKAARTTYTD